MYTVKNLQKTCGACPAQWEGVTVKGQEFYARFRFGYFRADIDNETIFGASVGQEGFGGTMETKRMCKLLHHLVTFITEEE